jgi:hypothetical protein
VSGSDRGRFCTCRAGIPAHSRQPVSANTMSPGASPSARLSTTSARARPYITPPAVSAARYVGPCIQARLEASSVM